MQSQRESFKATAQAEKNMGGPLRRNSVQDCIKEYIQNDDPTVVLSLLATTNNCDIQDKEGKTLLMVAATKGNTHLVQQLVEAGAAVNVRDNNKRSALFYATSHGYSATVNYLLHHGAHVSVNKTDRNSDTPLHVACRKKYCSCVRVLLKHGANRNAYNFSGETPLSIARSKGNTCMKQMLCPDQQGGNSEDIVYTNFNTCSTRRSKRLAYEEIEDMTESDMEFSAMCVEEEQQDDKSTRQMTMDKVPHHNHDYLELVECSDSKTGPECQKHSARDSSYTNWDPYEMDQKLDATETTPEKSAYYKSYKDKTTQRSVQQQPSLHYPANRTVVARKKSQGYTDKCTVQRASFQPQKSRSQVQQLSRPAKDTGPTTEYDPSNQRGFHQSSSVEELPSPMHVVRIVETTTENNTKANNPYHRGVILPTSEHCDSKNSVNEGKLRQEHTDRCTVQKTSLQPHRSNDVRYEKGKPFRAGTKDDDTTAAFDRVLSELTQPKLKKVPPPVKPKPTVQRKARKTMYENVELIQ